VTLLGGFGTVCSNGDNPEPEVEQMCFNADQFSQPEIATGLPAAAQINQDGWPDFQPAIQIIRVRRQVSAASWSEQGCRSAGDRFIGRIGGGSFVWEKNAKKNQPSVAIVLPSPGKTLSFRCDLLTQRVFADGTDSSQVGQE